MPNFTFTCSESCDIEPIPALTASVCEDQTEQGGISYVLWWSCNVRFAVRDSGETVDLKTPTGTTIQVGEITDTASWQLLKDNNMVGISPIGRGDLPAPSANTKKRKSCKPEEDVSYTYGMNFTWDQFDSAVLDGAAPESDEYVLDIAKNISKYGFTFIGCSGVFYFNNRDGVPWFNFSGAPTKVIPEDGVSDTTEYVFSPSWTYPYGQLETLYLPTILTDVLLSDAAAT